MPWPCFLLEDAHRERIFLRRYTTLPHTGWTCAAGYHDALSPIIAEVPSRLEADPVHGRPGHLYRIHDYPAPPHADADWPTRCACGCRFTETDSWQVFPDALWRDTRDGRLYSVHGNASFPDQAPIGALWNAWWLIDGPASNCTRKDDRVHKCWVRHGTPPNIHVDKNGNTCAAGAGSILMDRQGKGHYHGFLHNGQLTDNL